MAHEGLDMFPARFHQKPRDDQITSVQSANSKGLVSTANTVAGPSLYIYAYTHAYLYIYIYAYVYIVVYII